MSGDKMTRGDIAGMTAGDRAGDAAKTMEEATKAARTSGETLTEKEKTHLERRVMDWRNTFVDTFHVHPIFAFLEKNPDAVLEVYDAKTPGAEIGRLLVREGMLAVRRGNNISRITFGFNDRRYVLKKESAELLGEYEYKRDIAEVDMAGIAETRGFINSSSASVYEGKEERNRSGFSSLLKAIMGKGDVAYAVHDRQKLDSIYYKCSESEAKSLKEMARQGSLPVYQESGVTEVIVYKDGRESEFVEILKNAGFADKTCLPAKLKIDKAGVQFYPFYQVVV